MVGQFIWCAAHCLWVGSSFMLVTSAGLMAHHLFGCWHGDFRLRRKYGEAFDAVKARTSTLPFQAIWQGRQQLPADYYKVRQGGIHAAGGLPAAVPAALCLHLLLPADCYQLWPVLACWQCCCCSWVPEAVQLLLHHCSAIQATRCEPPPLHPH